MRVLVTGATGGVARSVITRFASDSRNELVMCGRAERNVDGYVRCDLSDHDAVEAMVKRIRPRLVIHLAGSFQNNLAADLAVNSLSAGWIAETLLANSDDARLVLVGSAAEYGLISADENPVPETHALRPVSVYGLTKTMQTQIGTYYAAARGADVVIARLFNVFGPGLSERLFIGNAERQIERFRRGEIEHLVFGNLDSERDYISTDEAARLIMLLAERGERGSIYNIGSGQPVRMRELLKRMLAVAGISHAPIRERQIEGRAAAVDLPCIYADVSRLRALDAN